MLINHIYRYPIKSFTPELRKKVFVNKKGKITGDRIAAFRIGDDDIYDGNWLPKKKLFITNAYSIFILN